MQFKSIHLKNIRSYSELELNFHSGSTLLSGDIGCGKTTILLSMEFALFGLMKGMLSGASLLRHGCKDASVKLSFSCGKNNYLVMRSLKKTSAGIISDAGYIEVNGIKTDCTAVELKQRVLSVLGYPDELLTKSKSLIYRYTVYTPQEDMKKIIFDAEEDRLEKLTKIFNVEKYKRIRENAEMYAKDLRAETRILQSLEAELSALTAQQMKSESEMEDKNIILQKASSEVADAERNMKSAEDKIKSMEDSAKEIATLKSELQILIVEKNNILRNCTNIKNDIISIEEQKKKLAAEIESDNKSNQDKSRSAQDIAADIAKYRELKQKNELQTIETKSRIMSIERKIEENEKLKKDILELTKCPVCLQDVNDEHKNHIAQDGEIKIAEMREKKNAAMMIAEKCAKNTKIISLKLEALDAELIELRSNEQKAKLRLSREALILDADHKILVLKDRQKKYGEDLSSNEETQKKIAEKSCQIQISEAEIASATLTFRKTKDSYLSLRMKEAEVMQSIKETQKALETNSLLQEAKKSQIQKIVEKKNLEHWLTNHFISLIEVIEKNVMSAIRTEFKEHFEEWFSMLIEDESITASLDERFTPVITQNGYDMELENLSGGEKTAIALAYRLSLNRVINSMMSSIQTKDILILDEPTDGFSSQQLDRVRDVLDALNSKQTIIVSHESKMESFVDNVIKIRKADHKSQVF